MIESVTPSANLLQVDSKILKFMEPYGVDIKDAINSLDNNLKNSLTTLYFLLVKKYSKTIFPSPPTSLSTSKMQKIKKMQEIRHIEARKDFRPTSRIKIVANSVSPKVTIDSRSKSQCKTTNRIKKIMQPKEPEIKPTTPVRKSNRKYKPIQTRTRLYFGSKSTPRNFEYSYRIKYPMSLISP